ncbi:RNA polymerase sigma factor [Kibdelosporangium aridum]|uniref:DNA-directed RNA polymerase specialized sigma subunit, sigma24 family n=1 Tax=Kibdelosporangium aridum TaxID=2030 RepID=A0A1Y5WUZ4_KIBAR|nr:sigma-70 family RNA polymerase sigma factor [Kibdelosporangium aridum]SMC53028.1 DNA-directed RNA polymerase specialized sigma subunit, sigma24 family [Kibdelosporangium aridum]
MRDTQPDFFTDRYQDIRVQVRVYLRHQFRSLVDIEEIADAAMERLYVRWHTVDDPLPWAIAVARNLALDELRKAPVARLEEEIVNSNGTLVSGLGVADQQLRVTAILQSLHALPRSQYTVIVLAALGFSNPEIAGITRLAENSIAHYLYEGRKNLEKILQYRRRRSQRHPNRSVRPPGKG